MAVYVDNMFMKARVGRINGTWCHMTADTIEELVEFADRLGLKRAWLQLASVFADTPRNRTKGRVGLPRPGSRDHFDVTAAVRARAVRLGAIEVRWGNEPWRDLAAEEEIWPS